MKLRSQEEIEKALENLAKEIKNQTNKCVHIDHPFDKDRKRFLTHAEKFAKAVNNLLKGE